ncbi:MAG: pectin acetylesterase-family hydrolase [Polyangiales bacterium]
MRERRLGNVGACAIALAIAATGCGDDSGSGGSGGAGGMGGGSPATCDVATATATQTCIADVNFAWQSCYADDDGPCADGDPEVEAALAALETTITNSCSDDEFLSLTVSALVGRLQNSCRSEAMSLASRSYGGPEGAAWASASRGNRSCLQAAQESGSGFIDEALASANSCLAAGTCDADTYDADVQALADAATQEVADACGRLENLIALTPTQYIDRAHHQADCILATTHANTDPLSLSCGPSRVDEALPRGEYMQVVLDGEEWGTLCGDGSPFAFQVRLAPEGAPLDRILISMQGGGVCVFEPDCTFIRDNVPGLFESLTDEAPTSGVMSNEPDNPFGDWTKVYLPYCNQDVFAGGGVPQEFTDFTVERYGAVNVRAAVEYVRNVLWQMLDEEDGDGYRPDQIVAAFGGFSAGAFGTLYNYHWLLDDLQWPATAAFPDAALALDSGGFTSVATLGNILLNAWAARPFFPPYCFEGVCAVGPVMYEATAPRLKAVPNQQFLILSNQNDQTQVNTTFFPSTAAWINEERATACQTRDLNGIHYYLTGVVDSVHVVSLGPLYDEAVDDQVMSDWLWEGVIADPDATVSRMEEGSFVLDIPGVDPFPCPVPP